MTQLVTKDEIEKLDYKEINARIDTIFKYDDFAWQKDRNVRISYHDRAKGLHKVLYQCPNCHTEYRMASEGSKLGVTAVISSGKCPSMESYLL